MATMTSVVTANSAFSRRFMAMRVGSEAVSMCARVDRFMPVKLDRAWARVCYPFTEMNGCLGDIAIELCDA